MAKYHCSSFKEVYKLYREDVKGALRGVVIDHDEGKEYPISKEQAEKEILSVVDELAYQCMQAWASGRAQARFAEAHGLKMYNGEKLREYMRYMDEERFKDYKDCEALGLFSDEEECECECEEECECVGMWKDDEDDCEAGE